jgi:glycosyltransferase involved in cell wall biosynthesis
VFFDHVPFMGGAEQSMLEILRTLDRSVFEPLLLLPEPGRLSDKALQLGIPVVYTGIPAGILKRKRYAIRILSLRTVWDAACLVPVIWRVVRLLRREHADIIHTNTLKAHLIGGIAGRLCGRRVVWHFRDILVRSSLRFWMIRMSGWLCDRVIAISGAVKDQFGADYPASRIDVVYNAIDGDEVRRLAAAGDKRAIRRDLGVPEDARLVGMVGQIARWKGQEFFIRAAALLAPRFPEVFFPIVGDVLFEEWEYKFRLLELVKQLGLERRVVFAGQRENVYPVMKELAVLAHCSIEPEPFGRVVIEAMALGVPVVAADTGAMPEIIDDGGDGLLARADDPAAIAAAIGRLLDDAGLRDRLVTQGRAKADHQFGRERMNGQLQRALCSLPA